MERDIPDDRVISSLYRDKREKWKENRRRYACVRARVHVCVYTSTGIFIAISSARLYSDCQATVYRHLADSRAKRPDMDSREMARCFFSDENEKQRRESVLCPLKSDTSSPSSPSPSLVGSWPVVPTNLDFRFFPFPSFPPPLFSVAPRFPPFYYNRDQRGRNCIRIFGAYVTNLFGWINRISDIHLSKFYFC